MTTLHARLENVSRRRFLQGMVATGGLVIAAEFLPARAFAYATGAGEMPHGVVSDPHVFISIDPNGIVTIFAHRSEMGTGSRPRLPIVAARGREADWATRPRPPAAGNAGKEGTR